MGRHLGLAGVLVLTGATSAFGLTDEEAFRNFRFNLINPGARSLAMGGAFVSIADDATAAQANPSGLAYLRNPEYFFEYRSVDNPARASVLTETLPGDIHTAVATGTDLEDTTSPSFLSAVIPFRETKRKWVVGFSRQEVLNSKNSTLTRFAFTFPCEVTNPSCVVVPTLVEGSGSIDIQAVNYNASVGLRLNDRLAIGGSVAFSRLDVNSDVANIILDPLVNLRRPLTWPANRPREILVPTVDVLTRIHDTDSDYAFNLGIVYKVLDQPVTIGAVYRRAPKFEVSEEIVVPAGLDLFNLQSTLGTSFSNTVHLPDSYGVSVSWQPNDRLTFSQDFERVEYSDLLDGYVPGVNILTDFDARFTVDDATQYRAGLEYVSQFPGLLLAWRGGAFTEGDPTIRAVTTGTNSFASRAAFPGKEDQVHLTGGLGLAWKAGLYKLDLAFDLAETDNEYLFSFIVRGK